MYFLASAAAAGSLTRIRCPHCELSQVRARVGPSTRLTCRRCKQSFTQKDANGYGRQMKKVTARPKRR